MELGRVPPPRCFENAIIFSWENPGIQCSEPPQKDYALAADIYERFVMRDRFPL